MEGEKCCCPRERTRWCDDSSLDWLLFSILAKCVLLQRPVIGRGAVMVGN